MPHIADAASSGGAVRPMPNAGFGRLLRELLSRDGGRVDMLARLRALYERHGTAVMQRLGPFTMVNLFGPDANRLVLLARNRAGSGFTSGVE